MRTVTITLPTGIDEQVATEALAEGVAVEDYLPRLIESALRIDHTSRRRNGLPLDEWLALLHQAPTEGTARTAITTQDLSRESIYEDRS